MSSDRVVVFVNYFTATLLPRAIASARAASTAPLRIVVVDNSGDAEEARRVGALDADERIEAPANPGYGAAANLGAASCRAGILIVANSDVEFFPGSIDTLAEELVRGVAACGPRFVWDRGAEWNLPPPQLPRLGESVVRIGAGLSRALAEEWVRKRQDERARFWSLESAVDEPVLSGAVLAFRAESFHSVGGFDPGYRLYFEEIDLLDRLRARGGRVRYVPAAVCRHLYNQSAGVLSDAGALYASSERRYYERKFGRFVGPALLSMRRPLPLETPPEDAAIDDILELGGGSWIVEATPLADFSTAAGRFSGPGAVKLPAELRESLRGSELFVRVIDRASGKVVRVLRLRRRPGSVH